MLSSEKGVYIAEAVTAKNTKQAKGRFRVYDEQNDTVLFFLSSCVVISSSIRV